MQTAVIPPEVHLSFLKESFQAQVRTGKPNRAGEVERGHSMAAIAVRDVVNQLRTSCLAMALPNFAMNIVTGSVPSK